MKRSFLFAVLIALTSPVMATGDGPRGFCNGPGDDCNRTYAPDNSDNSVNAYGGRGGRGGDGGDGGTGYGGTGYGGDGGTGIGLGLGIGKGGSSDVDVNNRNRLVNDNWLWTDINNRNRQSQDQDQFQGQGQHQGQSNFGANVGLGSGNKTKTKQIVNIEGDHYEAPKKPEVPAYAPSVNPATATAPCYATWSVNGGWAGLFAAGGGGYKKDHGCALGEVVRRATEANQPEVAEKALTLMLQVVMDEAGIEDDTAEDVTDAKPDYVSGGRDPAFAFQQSYGE